MAFKEICGISDPSYSGSHRSTVFQGSSSSSLDKLSSRTFRLSPVTWDLAVKVASVVGFALLFGLGGTMIANLGVGFPLDSLNTIAIGGGSSIVGGIAGYLVAQLIIKIKKDKSEDPGDWSDTSDWSGTSYFSQDGDSKDYSKNEHTSKGYHTDEPIRNHTDEHTSKGYHTDGDRYRETYSSRAQGTKNNVSQRRSIDSVDTNAMDYYSTKRWTQFGKKKNDKSIE